jgi:hypothetical protein
MTRLILGSLHANVRWLLKCIINLGILAIYVNYTARN